MHGTIRTLMSLGPIAGLVILLTLPVAGSGQDARERINELLMSTQTLKARFEQTVFDEKRQPIENSEGVVHIARPGKFRWDYRSPLPSLIVGDGSRVWIYDQDLDQVTVRPMDAALGQTPAMLLSSQRGIGDEFRVTALGVTDDLEWVQLAPSAPDATFESLRLGLVGNEIRVMEMRDNFGQTTTLRFSDTERNLSLETSLFEFTPPAGADVIRGE